MKVKLAGCYILQFCVSILLFLTIFVGIVLFTIFNQNYVQRTFSKTNYYGELYDAIEQEMSNYIIQSGFDESVIESLFTKEELKKDVDTFINKTYKNEKFVLDTTEVQNRLETNIDTFLAEHNITLEDKTAIDSFTHQIVDVYSRKVNILNNISIVGKALSLGKTYLSILFVVFILCTIGIYFVLCKFYKKKMSKIMCFTSGMLLVATYIYFINRLDIKHINLYTTYVSSFVSRMIKNILFSIGMWGVICLVIGILLIVCEMILLKRKKNEA